MRRLNSKPAPTPEVREPLELARAAASGDTAATAKLVRLVAPEMLRAVRGVLGPQSSDIDDTLQQALIGLIHALGAFRGECSAAGYACRIAFRTALAARKRAHQRRARYAESEEADTLLDSKAPPDISDARRRTELVRKLLDDIPTEQAEALAMRVMLGWSLEEIAGASGSPVNTIRSRLRLAKEALRRRVEADPALAEELEVTL